MHYVWLVFSWLLAIFWVAAWLWAMLHALQGVFERRRIERAYRRKRRWS